MSFQFPRFVARRKTSYRRSGRKLMCERLEQRRLLAVVSTSFEGINSSDFTIGDSPEAARFSGDAFSGVLGVPQL